MGLKRTDEFRQDAVRIALTSGLKRKQVADDLGVPCPTGHCIAMSRERHVDAEQMDHGASGHRFGVERGLKPRPRE